MGLWIYVSLLILLLCYSSTALSNRTCLGAESQYPDGLGYFSIRDCFYIVNREGSAILKSDNICKDQKLGAVIAVDKVSNKQVFNATSQIWYLSPKSGQLLNLWEEMFRMEPFSFSRHSRYVCLRPRTSSKEKWSQWLVSHDPNCPDEDGLIIKHEETGRLLTFNGVNKSVSLDPSRDSLGKGGLSAVVHAKEPFRLRYAARFYHKVDEDVPVQDLRSPISDQRWTFEPLVDSLFMIATCSKKTNGCTRYLALSDSASTKNYSSLAPVEIEVAPLDIDDPSQMWFREMTSVGGEVIRNLATGRLLDAAIDNTDETSLLFDLPPLEQNGGEDEVSLFGSDDGGSGRFPKISVYLVSSPFCSDKAKDEHGSSSFPSWIFDPEKQRISIHLPNVLKMYPDKSAIMFSGGRVIHQQDREKMLTNALEVLYPDCKVDKECLRQDRTHFAISRNSAGDAVLEQVIEPLWNPTDSPKIPARQHWVRVPLDKADDPRTLASLFSGSDGDSEASHYAS